MRSARASLFSLILIGGSQAALAATPFTYAQRTHAYSAWTPASRGDINTIGMGGATLAACTSISAAEANSAAYAMQTGSLSAQINRTGIDDQQIQRSGATIRSTEWGISLSPPPWGVSFASYAPITESGSYHSPLTARAPWSEVSVREFRLTGARTFYDSRLAIGISAEYVQAIREIGADAYNGGSPSFRVGALYRMPDHWILGATFVPSKEIGPADASQDSADLPGFNQSVIRPMQIGLGVGWLPNRFFKAGASLNYVGATSNTALLADQSVATGVRATWVPRVGASYVLVEFQNFKMEWAAGSYYEASRVADQSSRLHATTGLEANPYFINLGVGFDLSSNYKNVMASIGIDIVRTLRTFDIIPKDSVPAQNVVLPSINQVSADGMPDGLTQGEEKRFSGPTVEEVGKIVEEVPQNVANKLSGKPTSVEKETAQKKLDGDSKGKSKSSRKKKKSRGKNPPAPDPHSNGGNSGDIQAQP